MDGCKCFCVRVSLCDLCEEERRRGGEEERGEEIRRCIGHRGAENTWSQLAGHLESFKRCAIHSCASLLSLSLLILYTKFYSLVLSECSTCPVAQSAAAVQIEKGARRRLVQCQAGGKDWQMLQGKRKSERNKIHHSLYKYVSPQLRCVRRQETLFNFARSLINCPVEVICTLFCTYFLWYIERGK